MPRGVYKRAKPVQIKVEVVKPTPGAVEDDEIASLLRVIESLWINGARNALMQSPPQIDVALAKLKMGGEMCQWMLKRANKTH